MSEIDHGAARSFAREVVATGTKPGPRNLAAAYLELRGVLDDIKTHPARTIESRLHKVLRRVDDLIAALPKAPASKPNAERYRATVTINGFRGYIYETATGKFATNLRNERSSIYLGTFDTVTECETAIGKGWAGRRVRSPRAAARDVGEIREARGARCTFVIRKGNAVGAECGHPASGVPPRCGRHTPERLEQMTGRPHDAEGNVERGTGG